MNTNNSFEDNMIAESLSVVLNDMGVVNVSIEPNNKAFELPNTVIKPINSNLKVGLIAEEIESRTAFVTRVLFDEDENPVILVRWDSS